VYVLCDTVEEKEGTWAPFVALGANNTRQCFAIQNSIFWIFVVRSWSAA
jgi:hypothetical protein